MSINSFTIVLFPVPDGPWNNILGIFKYKNQDILDIIKLIEGNESYYKKLIDNDDKKLINTDNQTNNYYISILFILFSVNKIELNANHSCV